MCLKAHCRERKADTCRAAVLMQQCNLRVTNVPDLKWHIAIINWLLPGPRLDIHNIIFEHFTTFPSKPDSVVIYNQHFYSILWWVRWCYLLCCLYPNFKEYNIYIKKTMWFLPRKLKNIIALIFMIISMFSFKDIRRHL